MTGEVLVVTVLPTVASTVVVPSGNSLVEVKAGTSIEDTVVNTTGTIATPPVGEVQHSVEVNAELVTLVASIVVLAVAMIAYAVTVVAESLELSVVTTGTKTNQGREPLTYPETSIGRETLEE